MPSDSAAVGIGRNCEPCTSVHVSARGRRPAPRSSRHTLLAVCSALLGVSSLPASVIAQASSVRDSLGIRIIENRSLPQGAAALVRIAPRPTLGIGGDLAGPAHQFSGVVAATRLADGRVVVADRGAAELRVFGPQGAFLGTIGGRGDGPGEFRLLGFVDVTANGTIRTFDAYGGRSAEHDLGGRVLRTGNLSLSTHQALPAQRMVPGRLTDGSFFAVRLLPARIPREPTIVRDTIQVGWFGPDWGFRDEVARFPGLAVLRTPGGSMQLPNGVVGNSFSATGLPFARQTFLYASGDCLYAGDGDSAYEIRCYDGRGILRRLIRVAQPSVLVTSGIISAHRRAPQPPGTLSRPAVSPGIAAKYYPSTLPAFGALVADAAHRLWVMDYPLPGQVSRRWLVFGTDGRLLGWVSTPPGLEILEIGLDYLLGVARDDDGVETVQVFQFLPAGR